VRATTRRLLAVLIAAGALQGCVLSRQAPSAGGRSVNVVPVSGAAPATGELIAVSPDSLWVQQHAEITSMPLERVRKVEMRRSRIGGGQVVAYSAILGGVTGIALTLACGSVEDTNCGAVLPGVFLASVALGGLLALTVESNVKLSVSAADWRALRPYARFPQGLPDSLPRHAAGELTPSASGR